MSLTSEDHFGSTLRGQNNFKETSVDFLYKHSQVINLQMAMLADLKHCYLYDPRSWFLIYRPANGLPCKGCSLLRTHP